MRLTVVLALAMGSLVLVSTASALLLEWTLARRMTVEYLNDRATLTMDSIERGVHVHLDPDREAMDGLARLLADGRINPQDPTALTAVLMATLTARSELSAVTFIGPDLGQTTVRREPSGGLTVISSARPDWPDAAAVLAEMRRHDRTFWGEVVYAPGLGQSLINLRRAIYSGDTLIGYLAAGVTVGELSSLVTRLGEGANATPFILYGDNRVLAIASPTAIPQDASERKPLAAVDPVADPVLAGLAAGQPVELFRRARTSGTRVVEVDGGAVGPSIVMTRTVRDFGDVPWTIGVWFPASRLERATEPLRDGALAGLLILVVGIGASVLIGRRIARPIGAVTERATQISTLDTSQVQPLPPSRILEIDEQSRAFNAMLVTLRAFETYVPRSLVRRLIRSGRPGVIGSRQRDLTVMFTDIVGFTRLSEQLPPTEVAKLLNDHFTKLAHAVEAEGGTVDKFLGDGLMAFWGAPEKLKSRSARACRAALAIRAGIEAQNNERRAAGLEPIRVRIGVHRGPLIVGNIGSPDRINYTVVGDTVNVAQRLEQLGKEIGGSGEVVILVSDAVALNLGDRSALAPVGELAARGRAETIRAFSLLGTIDTVPDVAAAELVSEV
jgi:class 3 adenylate cyclase